jgi:hypothetical protein
VVNSARKGKDAELELSGLLRELSGWPVKRRLQEGRATDCGDLEGLPDCCAQVKWRNDPLRAQREALAALPAQQEAAGSTFAAAFIRHPGRQWVVVMTPAMFVTLLREATTP